MYFWYVQQKRDIFCVYFNLESSIMAKYIYKKEWLYRELHVGLQTIHCKGCVIFLDKFLAHKENSHYFRHSLCPLSLTSVQSTNPYQWISLEFNMSKTAFQWSLVLLWGATTAITFLNKNNKMENIWDSKFKVTESNHKWHKQSR